MEKSSFEYGISVVIPCLNEAETIQRAVIQALHGLQLTGLSGEVVVADNGSSDGSRELASRAGARVVEVQERGYGAALNQGILNAHYSIVVFGDADLSYPFESIPDLIRPIIDHRAQFVLGNRLNSQIEKNAMPFLNRWLGTPVLTSMIRHLHGLKTKDCNSGMRAFDRSIYSSLDLLCPGMEYASEMLIRVAQLQIKYAEVMIPFKKDARSRPPHLKRWRDGWRHLRFIVACGPTAWVIQLPAAISGLFYLIAFGLSLAPYFRFQSAVKYHTAFALIAFASPLFFVIVSIALVKAAFLQAGRAASPLIHRVSQLSETVILFFISSVLIALLGIESGLLFRQWRSVGYGPLQEPSAVIRITIYSILAAGCLSLDLGFGLLRLLPFKTVQKSKENHEMIHLRKNGEPNEAA